MGLQQGDLIDLVLPVFEVDSFKSKMGDDEDIVVASFSLKEQNAANDLVDFIEKSYNFVLDADSTVSELDQGTYKVFVEIERNRKINDNIMEMLYGIGKLSKMESFKFRYHKDFTSREANIDNLQEMVPIDANTYVLTQNPISENAEKFFSKTPIETLEFINETIFIKKPFADIIHMEIIDFDTNDKIMENINETFDVNAFPEILFLTKYLGEYSISKYGDKLLLESNGSTLVVKRT